MRFCYICISLAELSKSFLNAQTVVPCLHLRCHHYCLTSSKGFFYMICYVPLQKKPNNHKAELLIYNLKGDMPEPYSSCYNSFFLYANEPKTSKSTSSPSYISIKGHNPYHTRPLVYYIKGKILWSIYAISAKKELCENYLPSFPHYLPQTPTA